MVERTRLNKAKISHLVAPETGRRHVYDEELRDLCIRVYPSGRKAWYFRRRVNGRLLWVKIGSTDEWTPAAARAHVGRELIPAMLAGENPNQTKREARSAETLADVWGLWQERHASRLKPKTRRGYEDGWRLHIAAKLGNRPLADLTRYEVERWHAKVAEKAGPYAANRALTLLRALFNRARTWGHEGPNPADGIERFQEEPRERILTEAEARAFLAEAANEPQPFRDLLLLLFLTGARKSNVCRARWEQFDIGNRLWTIPGQHAKGKRPIVVPLVPAAVGLLEERQKEREEGCPWLFPSPRTSRKTPGEIQPVGEIRFSFDRVCRRAGIQGVRPHDIRRTVGSYLAMKGAPLLMVARLLGHRDTRTTQRAYAFLDVDTLRDPLADAVGGMVPVPTQPGEDGPEGMGRQAKAKRAKAAKRAKRGAAK